MNCYCLLRNTVNFLFSFCCILVLVVSWQELLTKDYICLINVNLEKLCFKEKFF